MSIFPPTPGENRHSQGIQRLSEEEKQEDLQLKEEFSAASAPGEGKDDKNQDIQLKAESDNASPEEAPQFDLQLKSIQTKLTVGQPGDKYEQEADNMAALVMAMPEEAIQRQTDSQTDEEKDLLQPSQVANSISRLVQRLPAEDSEELQMKPGLQRSHSGNSQASGNIESNLASAKGGGSPLPDDVRNFMEPRFGADLSKVRVHTDISAVQMNKELGASAFAHGNDIFYGAGKSPGKNELTAHELTHTIQQGGLVARRFTNPLEKKENKLQRKLHLDRSPVLTPKILTKENVSASKNELRDTLQQEQQISNKEPHQETSIKSQEKDDRESILQTIWKGLIGDFEENPSLSSIGVNFLLSIIPGVDQVADLRDLAANLYFLVIKGQYSNPERWINLAFTLIGIVPVVGSVIKSASKVLYHKAAAQIIGNLGELLQPIRKLFPEIGNIRALQNLINREWSNWASFGKNKWQEILNNFYAKVNSLPDFTDYISGNKKKIFLDAISRTQQESTSALAKAFNDIRRKIDEVLEELGRRLDPNGNLATANGAPLPNRVDDGMHRPARIEGNQTSGSNHQNSDRNPQPSGQFPKLHALEELSEKSRQNISKWPRDLQVRVNDLLAQEDLVVKAAIERAAEQSSEDAIARVNRLVLAMQNKPAVPESFTRGRFFARGGTSELFEMEGHPDLLIKPGGGRLPNEARAMVEMEMLGIPTVYIKKTTNNGQNVLILQRIDGVGSKDFIGRVRSPLNPPENTEVVTQKTIDDLEQIYRNLRQNSANIGDFQFIIRSSDGSVFVNDPVSFTQGRGPSGDIRNIIDRFKKILKERNRGGN